MKEYYNPKELLNHCTLDLLYHSKQILITNKYSYVSLHQLFTY